MNEATLRAIIKQLLTALHTACAATALVFGIFFWQIGLAGPWQAAAITTVILAPLLLLARLSAWAIRRDLGDSS